jgi:hypothetical protein
VICDKHNDHVNHKCPILKMLRPVAHAVGYAVHGLGFYHIPRPPLPRERKDSRTALISVEGGCVTVEEIRRQLERLFPRKWTWELKAHEGNACLAKFPSKVELQRAVAFGGADIRGEGVPAGVKLRFEVWQEKEVGFLLPKVWIRVFRLQRELYEFLDLWATRSMLGSTQTVDMETTRKGNFGRVQVAVLNPSLIPEQLDVVIGDHYFEVEFEVERLGLDENGEEAEFEWPSVMEEGGEEDFDKRGQRREEEVFWRLTKKQKIDEAESEKERKEEDIKGAETISSLGRSRSEACLRRSLRFS